MFPFNQDNQIRVEYMNKAGLYPLKYEGLLRKCQQHPTEFLPCFCHVFLGFSCNRSSLLLVQRCEWSLRLAARSVLHSGYKASRRRCFVALRSFTSYVCIHHVYVCTSPFKCLYESYIIIYIYNMFRSCIVWFVSDSHVIHIFSSYRIILELSVIPCRFSLPHDLLHLDHNLASNSPFFAALLRRHSVVKNSNWIPGIPWIFTVIQCRERSYEMPSTQMKNRIC